MRRRDIHLAIEDLIGQPVALSSLKPVLAGTWARNPARGDCYGIRLPVRVGSSNTFDPTSSGGWARAPTPSTRPARTF